MVSFENRGFTLIEALIAMAIGLILILFIAASISYFGICTRDILLKFCLTNAVDSGFSACRNGINPVSISCGNYTITVTSNVDCGSISNCTDVTITARYGSKVFNQTGKVCRW
ncbi:MAG: PulJ/GspJ family protein [Thermosulfidibacteraceae bacterium]